MQYDLNGTPVIFRRVKRTNELIIGNNVYGEIEMLVEPPHELTARYAGHTVFAGYDGIFSYICIDGVRVVKKFRIY